jgi:hypothetical protein
VNTLIVEISQEKNNFHFEPNNFCPYIVSDWLQQEMGLWLK